MWPCGLPGSARRLSANGSQIAVCSSSILAETRGYAVSFSNPWHGKWRVFERHKLYLTDQLQPSTNSDKLSERGYGWDSTYCSTCPRSTRIRSLARWKLLCRGVAAGGKASRVCFRLETV